MVQQVAHLRVLLQTKALLQEEPILKLALSGQAVLDASLLPLELILKTTVASSFRPNT